MSYDALILSHLKIAAPPIAKKDETTSHTKNDGSFVALVACENHATIV
jgi:hypothetical protein